LPWEEKRKVGVYVWIRVFELCERINWRARFRSSLGGELSDQELYRWAYLLRV